MSAANEGGGSGEGCQAGNLIAVAVEVGESIVEHLHIACPVESERRHKFREISL